MDTYNYTQAGNGDIVIALHCSGGNAKQWRALGQTLDRKHALFTPENCDAAADLTWQGERPFTLADEARKSLQIIDQTDQRVHLVGHSYGGALALHIALARPLRIASIALYEPCAFHLLPQLGPTTLAALEQIRAIAFGCRVHCSNGDYWSAMQGFVDYWNGEGSWSAMKTEYQDHLMSWAPNANHAFDALFTEGTPLHTYRELQIPVRLLQGDCSPDSVQAISNALMGLLPDCQIDRLAGIGHMGPLTHADYVARLISAHIESYSSTDSRLGNSENTLIEFADEAA